MAAQIVKAQAARWQVIVPWKRGEQTFDVVAAELTTNGTELTIKLIRNPLTFPLERTKMFLDALRDAVASMEGANASNT